MGGRWAAFNLRLWKLRNDLYILYLVLRHPGTPFKFKAAILAMAAYLVSPVDVIPAVVPLAGMADDFLVMMVTILVTFKILPEDILKDCRKKAEITPLSLKVKNFLAISAAVILGGLLLIWLILSKNV